MEEWKEENCGRYREILDELCGELDGVTKYEDQLNVIKGFIEKK